MDFGGALGGTYHQCRSFLSTVPSLCWSIIEQPHFVDAGRAEFETDVLRFFSSVEECEQLSGVDAVLLSGVLQYLPDALSLLRRFVAMAVPTIIVDRTPEANTPEDIFAVQVVPPEIYPASTHSEHSVRARSNQCSGTTTDPSLVSTPLIRT